MIVLLIKYYLKFTNTLLKNKAHYKYNQDINLIFLINYTNNNSFISDGAPARSRTADLLITNQESFLK